MRYCECGCGEAVTGNTRNGPRRFVTGHNLRQLKRTVQHRAAIAEAQRRAWQTKRTRLPVGTRRLTSDGYVRVKVVPGKGTWVLEHVLVMEEHVGRRIEHGEVIHHINGVRSDNRPQNLFLCRDRTHHNEVHASQDEALRAVMAAGLVVFRDGRYEAVLRGRD